jgi:hypothetical protein
MRAASLTLCALVCSLLAAEPLEPGLKPGDELPGPFHPFNITGKEKYQGKFHCLVSQHGLNPVVLVFVNREDASPGVVSLLKKLDTAVEKNQGVRLGSFAVFLTPNVKDLALEDEKRDTLAAALRDKFADMKNVAVALEVQNNVKEPYKLQPEAEVTVLLYSKYRVLASHAYRQGELTDEAINALMDEIGSKTSAMRAAISGKKTAEKK